MVGMNSSAVLYRASIRFHLGALMVMATALAVHSRLSFDSLG